MIAKTNTKLMLYRNPRSKRKTPQKVVIDLDVGETLIYTSTSVEKMEQKVHVYALSKGWILKEHCYPLEPEVNEFGPVSP